ncbi:MAG: NADP-specific glutamate dehydrogenase [Bacilli bacterium]|nr:NADP-specific glutamate dehydrogenase [Bacilli bacterium]
MNKYIEEVLEKLGKENADQPEFLQAAKEVLESLEPIITKNEEKYRSQKLLEKLTVPNEIHMFDVSWLDDKGVEHVNKGYRVQFNNAVGVYKGGLRLHPTVNLSVLKFLGFEQCFKNALTGLPMGGAKGGSDFDPKGKSDNEVRNFCIAFTDKLYPFVGVGKDVPAGDIGTGAREIRFIGEEYLKKTGSLGGAFTGKPLDMGGSLVRTEATGYGLVYFTEEMLKKHGKDFKDKTVVVTGSGNVAIYAAEKAAQLGAIVVGCCDSTGWIYDEKGLDLAVLKDLKEVKRARLSEYPLAAGRGIYHEGKGIWNIKCDIYLPCATQNELDLEGAKTLVANGCFAVCEGANMPTTLEATKYLQEHGVYFAPGKASNAGGVSCSYLEMEQNAANESWSFEKTDARLKEIMVGIFHNLDEAAKDVGMEDNYVVGANIAGFKIIVDAMEQKGLL